MGANQAVENDMMGRRIRARLLGRALALAFALIGAVAPVEPIRIDTWELSTIGPLDPSCEWERYPRSAATIFKEDPPPLSSTTVAAHFL